MSTTGGGQIVALPAGAVAVAAGAALLAAAGAVVLGGVVVYQGGKAVVACGRKIGEAVRRHAAQQAAINRRCAEYEKLVLRRAAEAAPLAHTAAAAERARLLQRLRERRKQAEQPAPALPLTLPPDPGLEAQPVPPSALFDHADLDRAVDRLESEIEDLHGLIESLDRPEWSGLISTADLQRDLDSLRQAAEDARSPEPDAGARLVYDLRRELHSLRARAAVLAGEGRARHARRQQVAAELAGAAERLEAKSRALAGEPELQPALAVADSLLANADELFKAGELEAASATARTAQDYVEELSGSLAALRRSNLAVALQALRDYVAGFGFPPDDPAPLALAQRIGRAEALLAGGQLAECWQALEAAQAQAETLADDVVERLELAQQDAAAQLAVEALEEMGYRAGAVSASADGSAEFTAQRPDGAYFRVWITADGLLQYKAEKFGSADCQAETKRFFAELTKRGMVVDAQSEFNLTATAARLREVMLRRGFTTVHEERAEDGRLVLTGTRADGRSGQATVGFDPPLPAPEAAAPPPGQAAVPMAEVLRRMEAERLHAQRVADERRRRRLRA